MVVPLASLALASLPTLLLPELLALSHPLLLPPSLSARTTLSVSTPPLEQPKVSAPSLAFAVLLETLLDNPAVTKILPLAHVTLPAPQPQTAMSVFKCKTPAIPNVKLWLTVSSTAAEDLARPMDIFSSSNLGDLLPVASLRTAKPNWLLGSVAKFVVEFPST